MTWMNELIMAPKNAATKETIIALDKAKFFLLVYLREFFFSDLGLKGRKKEEKKLWKWPVDWSFSELFFF